MRTVYTYITGSLITTIPDVPKRRLTQACVVITLSTSCAEVIIWPGGWGELLIGVDCYCLNLCMRLLVFASVHPFIRLSPIVDWPLWLHATTVLLLMLNQKQILKEWNVDRDYWTINCCLVIDYFYFYRTNDALYYYCTNDSLYFYGIMVLWLHNTIVLWLKKIKNWS